MVFNYSSVFIGLACAMLGIGIVKISAEDAKERLATSQMDTVLIEETPEPCRHSLRLLLTGARFMTAPRPGETT